MIKTMIKTIRRLRPPTKLLVIICIILSGLAHALAVVLIERFGVYDFGSAVTEPATVMIDIGSRAVANSLPAAKKPATAKKPQASKVAEATAARQEMPEKSEVAEAQPDRPATPEPQPEPRQLAPAPPLPPSATKSEEFYLNPDSILPAQKELLSYQIALLGMPVGSGQLDASNSRGELRILTSVRSNSVISAIYHVDNSTDTRLIKGRYLLTRIRQKEGQMVRDTGFNLMFHEQKIFWVDRLKRTSSTEPLKYMDTLDVIAGFYYLRLQPLAVGSTVTLRIYDGDATTLVPVEVLRQETLSLPGMRSAETLVLKPAFSEHGFFKNNKELLIWVTNDSNRVPVRIEATTPLGRVAAELVSSERTVATP